MRIKLTEYFNTSSNQPMCIFLHEYTSHIASKFSIPKICIQNQTVWVLSSEGSFVRPPGCDKFNVMQRNNRTVYTSVGRTDVLAFQVTKTLTHCLTDASRLTSAHRSRWTIVANLCHMPIYPYFFIPTLFHALKYCIYTLYIQVYCIHKYYIYIYIHFLTLMY